MMVGNYKAGFRVKPLATKEIRTKAMNIRSILIPSGPDFDLGTFIEGLEHFGITYDIVDDTYLPRGVEASCIPEDRIIYITTSTYRAACRNDERTRFTIFHELGHLLLAHSRTYHRDTTAEFPIFENSEWQADQFSAEILMPLDVIKAKGLITPWQLQDEFGVSFQAANYRLSKLRSKNEI